MSFQLNKKIEGAEFTRVYITPEFLGADHLVRGGGVAGIGGEWSKKKLPGALRQANTPPVFRNPSHT